MAFNIAIDGPAGAGKSTIAKEVAGELGFMYVDTGAMYRTIALGLIAAGTDIEDEDALQKDLDAMNVEAVYQDGAQIMYLDGKNVTDQLRREEVGNMASMSSAKSPVRAKLLSLQRDVAAKYDLIMDGRDIGTLILPDAPLKIYLTASVEVRAKRRYDELCAKGEECDLAQIEKEIRERDWRDMNRDIAPLKQADDAILVDRSFMSIEEVTERIVSLARERM